MSGEKQKPEPDGAKFPEFGLTVQVWIAEDGATVVQIDGSPPDDEDCEHMRVYLNEAIAGRWDAA